MLCREPKAEQAAPRRGRSRLSKAAVKAAEEDAEEADEEAVEEVAEESER